MIIYQGEASHANSRMYKGTIISVIHIDLYRPNFALIWWIEQILSYLCTWPKRTKSTCFMFTIQVSYKYKDHLIASTSNKSYAMVLLIRVKDGYAWYPLSYFNPWNFHLNFLFYNFISLLHDQMIEFDHNFKFEASFRFKEYNSILYLLKF